MLKRITLLARRDDLTFDEFSNHWFTVHGDIVKDMPMVHGYIQNPIKARLLTALNAENPFSFDGIVELWFKDQAAQDVAFAADAAKLLPKDELNFIRGITIFPVTEDRSGPEGLPVKVIIAARFGDGSDRGQDNTKALVGQLAALDGVQVVSVNHLDEVGWREHLWHEPLAPNALIELGFDSEGALDAFAGLSGLADIYASLTDGNGVLEAYQVSPRRII
ncbi:EthD domain-containing protein [Sinisalibacter aestuarii]|uniref:EthD domain-containing protein n=1 Tax=Sinisalibacter aestuarii TaxID=2949426 RepID=A0ABQ5LQ11_9RHOB|nr:EthD domain-containing protein [Sinisalibacter aestuarii]GKY87090.1 hypothetical protein STA1M1_09590 [Sinisalibacter aestuarii]